jgi:hypothetical protein
MSRKEKYTTKNARMDELHALASFAKRETTAIKQQKEIDDGETWEVCLGERKPRKSREDPSQHFFSF